MKNKKYWQLSVSPDVRTKRTRQFNKNKMHGNANNDLKQNDKITSREIYMA